METAKILPRPMLELSSSDAMDMPAWFFGRPFERMDFIQRETSEFMHAKALVDQVVMRSA